MRLVATPKMRQMMEDAGHPCPIGPTISWSDLKAAYARSGYAARQLSLRSVCNGSSIAFDDTMSPAPSPTSTNSTETEATKTSRKSPELVRHLQDLQHRLDQKLYDRMVRDVTAEERRADAARDISFSTYKEQMRYGAHVISMMVVFFLFGYFASVRLVTSDALRVLCGAVGMFAAMVMETTLFIFRDNRDVKHARDVRDIHEAIPTKEATQHPQRDETANRPAMRQPAATGKVKIT